MKRLLGLLALGLTLLGSPALASNCSTYPYTLTNGQTADANQVMANFNSILSCANTNLLAAPISGASLAAGAAVTNLGYTPLDVAGSNSMLATLTTVAGTTTIPTIVIPAGVGLTVPVAGAIEFDGSNLYVTKTSGPTRETLAYVDGSNWSSSLVLPNGTTATTQTVGDNTTKVATDAFVIANKPVIQAATFTYSVASGSAADVANFSNATWTQRKLNTTVSNTISGMTLTTNQLTIPVGTYEITYGASVYAISGTGNNLYQSRFRDTTGSASFCVSGPEATVVQTNELPPSGATCILTVATQHVFEIETWVNLASTTTNGGFPASTGENEVYVRVTLTKID